MSITAAELAQIYPACADPELYARLFSEAWREFGLDSRNARAGMLGILGGETGGALQVKREDMTYSPSRGRIVFGQRGVKCQALAPLDDSNHRVRDDRGAAYAACVYENMLGNGPRTTMEGWTYRGGGMIGITGKELYGRLSKALGIDFLGNPDLLGEPRNSVRAAVWFVTKLKPECHRLLQAADEGSYMQACLMVGNNADEAARQRRLAFRRTAMKIVRPAGTKRDDSGNVTIANIEDSTILQDGTKGQGVATIAAVAGTAAPIVTSIAGMPWQTAAVLGLTVLALAAGAVWYFTKVKRARRQLHDDGVA